MKKTVFTVAVPPSDPMPDQQKKATGSYSMEVNSPNPLTFEQINRFCTMLSGVWSVDKNAIVISQ